MSYVILIRYYFQEYGGWYYLGLDIIIVMVRSGYLLWIIIKKYHPFFLVQRYGVGYFGNDIG